jgi:hypothetical protein
MYVFNLVILLAFLLLLLCHGYDILTNRKINYFGIAPSILVAVSMIIQIRQYKKEK